MGLPPVAAEDAAYEALRAQARRPTQPSAHPADTRAMAPIIHRVNARLAATDAELAVLDRDGNVASVVPLGRGITLSAGGVLRVAGKLVSVPDGAGGAVVREVGTGRLLFAL